MERDARDTLARVIDGLVLALEEERYRHVGGLEPAPALARLFEQHDEATHPETVARLVEEREPALRGAVAALVAERQSAAEEERWRSAEAAALVVGPDGPVPLATAEAGLARQADPAKRRQLSAAVAEALEPATRHREAAAEQRVKARAEGGLVPDWERVIEGDAVLNLSEDAWRDLLAHAAERDLGLRPGSRGSLQRADLLRLLAFPAWDGAFRRAGLPGPLREAHAALGLDAGALRIGETTRPAAWPGAHAVGARVSFRPRGGLPDWLDLFDVTGRAAAAARHPPTARDPTFGAALGWLLSSLLLEPAFLSPRLGLSRRESGEVNRALALRALFTLRVTAAALRVATEAARGLSGQAWREAHREALSAATHAGWDGVRAARDAETGPLAIRLAGFMAGERLRLGLRDRLDEDWWRNPRTPDQLAGLLAAGRFDETEPPSAPEAILELVRRLETGSGG